jgi:hypothetical protein
MRRMLTASALLAAMTVVGGCDHSPADSARPEGSPPTASPSASPTAGPTSATGPRIFALLADRRLLVVSGGSGRIERMMSLGPDAPTPDVGRFLAFSPDRRTLYVLVPWTPRTRQVVAAVDRATLRIRARLRLPRGVAFRSLVAGSESGRLYVFGNRPAATRRPAPRDAVVAVLDPASGAVHSRRTVRKADGRFWWVLDAAVSEDERRLYVSYHGGCSAVSKLCTTGADRLDVGGGRMRRCRGQTYPDSGCLGRVHGAVAAYESGVVAATGEGPIVQMDRHGRIARAWKSELRGNHLMQFALDRKRRLVYGIGSCGYRGGLSRIDLNSGRSRLTGDPSSASGRVCGERIAVGPSSLLVVAANPRPVPQGSASTLLLVDATTGALTRSVAVPSEALDLVVAP